MDTTPFDAILTQTLDDDRLSRTEETVLRELVAKLAPDARERGVLRSRVFAAVEARLDTGDAPALLQWARRLCTLIDVAEAPAGARASEAWFSPGDACVQRLQDLLHEARSRVDVCVFTITDDRITDALLAIHRRGVKVRIISDDDKREDRGSDIDDLARRGVPVAVDRSPHHMHHKFALFDQRTLLTGSYNWTRSAARDNAENFVVTDDPRLAGLFQEEFDRLWSQFST